MGMRIWRLGIVGLLGGIMGTVGEEGRMVRRGRLGERMEVRVEVLMVVLEGITMEE